MARFGKERSNVVSPWQKSPFRTSPQFTECGSVRRLTDNPATYLQPTWSPDGNRIAFTPYRGEGGASRSWKSMTRGIGSRTAVLQATRCGSGLAAIRPSVAVDIGCPRSDTMSR